MSYTKVMESNAHYHSVQLRWEKARKKERKVPGRGGYMVVEEPLGPCFRLLKTCLIEIEDVVMCS